jgi:hypothetical protein
MLLFALHLPNELYSTYDEQKNDSVNQPMTQRKSYVRKRYPVNYKLRMQYNLSMTVSSCTQKSTVIRYKATYPIDQTNSSKRKS